MDPLRIKGQWNVIKGKIRQHWGKLTDDDLDRINGRRDELIGRLQKAYGRSRDEAEAEVNRFEQETEVRTPPGRQG